VGAQLVKILMLEAMADCAGKQINFLFSIATAVRVVRLMLFPETGLSGLIGYPEYNCSLKFAEMIY
jgi:hypothetical protein